MAEETTQTAEEPVEQVVYEVDGRTVNAWGQPVDEPAKPTGRALGDPTVAEAVPPTQNVAVVGNGGTAFLNLTDEQIEEIKKAGLEVRSEIPEEKRAPEGVKPATPEQPRRMPLVQGSTPDEEKEQTGQVSDSAVTHQERARNRAAK